MEKTEYKLHLLQNIKPWAKEASGGKEINCRCFYCSDSKTYSKGHMYIKIPQTENDVSTFYCQKCKTSGIVTPKILMEWDAYDSSIATELSLYNKEVLSKPQNRIFKGYEIYNIKNNFISNTELSKIKLDYINSRIGTNLSYKDCVNLKIVLNLNDILYCNKLRYTRDPKIVQSLNDNFVGFLSHDNAFLNMRNLNLTEMYESINKRYINYNLVGKFDNTCRFYNVPSIVDMNKLISNPIQLHVAEGPFDILSIYLNLRKERTNVVYTSIGGSGYKGIIRYFILKLKIPYMEIHIYPDNDISVEEMISIKNYLSIFGYSLYIHRNRFPGEKDFGVPKNRMDEYIERW